MKITLFNANKTKGQLVGVNRSLQDRINKLIKELETVKEENYKILRENKQLLASLNIQKISIKDEVSDNDLLLAQLEQETEVLTKELKEVRERESIWKMQVEIFKKSNENVVEEMD